MVNCYAWHLRHEGVAQQQPRHDEAGGQVARGQQQEAEEEDGGVEEERHLAADGVAEEPREHGRDQVTQHPAARDPAALLLRGVIISIVITITIIITIIKILILTCVMWKSSKRMKGPKLIVLSVRVEQLSPRWQWLWLS